MVFVDIFSPKKTKKNQSGFYKKIHQNLLQYKKLKQQKKRHKNDYAVGLKLQPDKKILLFTKKIKILYKNDRKIGQNDTFCC